MPPDLYRTYNYAYHNANVLKIANKVIKDNQEGSHNSSMLSLNSYKPNVQIKLNIKMVIKRKAK
jgi:hypothetical protein